MDAIADDVSSNCGTGDTAADDDILNEIDQVLDKIDKSSVFYSSVGSIEPEPVLEGSSQYEKFYDVSADFELEITETSSVKSH